MASPFGTAGDRSHFVVKNCAFSTLNLKLCVCDAGLADRNASLLGKLATVELTMIQERIKKILKGYATGCSASVSVANDCPVCFSHEKIAS